MDKGNPFSKEEILEGKIFALLAYLSILCIIPLLFKKENSFVLKHGKQGLVLFVGEVAVFIVQLILGAWFLKLGMVIFGVFSFAGIIQSLKGEYFPLPLVSDIADQITL